MLESWKQGACLAKKVFLVLNTLKPWCLVCWNHNFNSSDLSRSWWDSLPTVSAKQQHIPQGRTLAIMPRIEKADSSKKTNTPLDSSWPCTFTIHRPHLISLHQLKFFPPTSTAKENRPASHHYSSLSELCSEIHRFRSWKHVSTNLKLSMYVNTLPKQSCFSKIFSIP